MRYEIYLTQRAEKELSKLNPRLRKRIFNALVVLRDYGFIQRLNIKKLKGLEIITGLELASTASYSGWRSLAK